MTGRNLALLIALTGLSACVGSRAAAPEHAAVVAPDGWRDHAGQENAALSAAWWRSFSDPALDRLVDKAIAGNMDLAIAASRIEEARAQFRQTRAQQMPQVDLAGGGGPQRIVNPFGIGTDQVAGQAQLAISYDLDLFGRLAQASEASRASLLATQAGRDTVRLAIVSAAVQGYFGLRMLDARLAVLEETAEARRSALHLASRRASVGYAPLLDQRQAEAELQAADALIPATKLAIRRQENALSLLTGALPGPIERGHALAEFDLPQGELSVPSRLLRSRPDIFQAEQGLVAADHGLDSARAAFMPTVRLSAAGGLIGSTVLGDPVSIFSLGGSILAPLFQGGRLQAQADAAAARRDQAAFAYRRTVLTAFREVEDALAAIARTSEQARALDLQRRALEQAFALTANRYRAGYSPYLEQLDAQRTLLAAQLNLVQAQGDALAARVALYQALGGGWDEARSQRQP